jgi:hypothetical protein
LLFAEREGTDKAVLDAKKISQRIATRRFYNSPTGGRLILQ